MSIQIQTAQWDAHLLMQSFYDATLHVGETHALHRCIYYTAAQLLFSHFDCTGALVLASCNNTWQPQYTVNSAAHCTTSYMV